MSTHLWADYGSDRRHEPTREASEVIRLSSRLLLAVLPIRGTSPFASPVMRRSTRLSSTAPAVSPFFAELRDKLPPVKKRAAPKEVKPPPAKKQAAAKKAESPKKAASLAHASRAREEQAWNDGVPLVIGCDEAGRGPLAGPVVAASCALPADMAPIPGVGDSKTITDEAQREALYEQIVSTPGVLWSARVVSAARIDDINIVRRRLLRLPAVPIHP